MSTVSFHSDEIATQIFDTLSRAFPVACSSDEFFYFPHVRPAEPIWDIWDDFSPERVAEIVHRLSAWEEELTRLAPYQFDFARETDIALLLKLVRTLREQLAEVKVWKSQPTFYLTLACIGLSEAMESEDPGATHDRAKGLPAFLQQATHNLDHIPLLFRDMGLEMVSDTRNYLALLKGSVPELRSALTELDRFEDTLMKISTRNNALLPSDILEHIVRFHLQADMDIEEIEQALEQEIKAMQQILSQESRECVPDIKREENPDERWIRALNSIPTPAVGSGGLIELYSDEAQRIAEHCLGRGLVSPSTISDCPLRVLPMPSFLSAIRTASSYSIKPGHPPSGGVFYIFNATSPEETRKSYHREYRMLTTHETYPGHHLLDISRWGLERPIRRVFEQPLFYEGWACFAEEIMRITGYFSAPGDRLLLAKRRLWRAVRAKVDMGIQTGRMDFPVAAGHLAKTGMDFEQTLSSVRKYALNTGYQLCYTLGLLKFLDLYDRFGRDDLRQFLKTVLREGEIPFPRLEEVLKNADE